MDDDKQVSVIEVFRGSLIHRCYLESADGLRTAYDCAPDIHVKSPIIRRVCSYPISALEYSEPNVAPEPLKTVREYEFYKREIFRNEVSYVYREIKPNSGGI